MRGNRWRTLALPAREIRYSPSMKSKGIETKRELCENPFPTARRSASADASLRAEIRRVEKMTIEERIRAALSLGKGFKGLQTSNDNR
jgi:hypothetical protein